VNVPGHGLLLAEEVVNPGFDVGADAGDGQAGVHKRFSFCFVPASQPSHLNLSRVRVRIQHVGKLRIKQTL
jgi:hypothetical protein